MVYKDRFTWLYHINPQIYSVGSSFPTKSSHSTLIQLFVMSYFKFPSAQLESLWCFRTLSSHVYSCCAFTPYPICYVLIYGIYLFIWTNVLTYEWWRGLQFSNKNDLHHKCLINATFYTFWQLQTSFESPAQRNYQFSICKIHTVQDYSPSPLTRVLPKGCNCIFFFLLMPQVSALSLCCNSACCNVICA